ncbi:MAG: long-chain acyl-CoA synthetase, partial [Actinomycetota bacterium]|nr:long-chain acyl-CoA synthetase [Actinomycetota bacterium]
MAEHLRELAEADPDGPAVIDEFAEISRTELNTRVNRLVHGLRAAGVGPGDAVAVLAGNRHENIEAVMACGVSSWVLVPLNWHLTAEEIAYILNDSGATALLADTEFAAVATEAVKEAPGVTVRLAFGGGARPVAADAASVGGTPPVPPGDGFEAYEDVLAAASPDEPADQASGTYMFYTSGTTGRPKGVRSTSFAVGMPVSVHTMLLGGLAGMLQVPDGGVCLVNAPIYHGGPFLFSMLPAYRGATLVVRRRFDAEEMLRLIDEYRVTTAYSVPTHFVRLLRLPEETKAAFDGRSLKAVFHTGAPCAPEVKRQMLEWWGPVIHELYSATETGGLGCFVTGDEWLTRPGTVGRPLPVVSIEIVGDDGAVMPAGEAGTVYVRNLIGGDFSYHGAPEKTAEAHRAPGLMTVGDIGYLDDDGYLFLCDRKIDMIISGGVNIYPAEIEAVLVNHPGVLDAAVFGIPHDEYGEEVKAVVRPAPGHEPSDKLGADILAYARDHLARYKVPRSIAFTDEFPRTETG